MVFLTTENMESTKRFLPKVNSIVVPNAIDLDEYKAEKKQSKLIEGLKRPIYLGTSAFERYKRNDLIIKALSKLDDGSLLLLGDGTLKDETVKLGNKLLGSRFRYGGVIPHSQRAEIINLYKNVDIFVQAARKEAFGVVFLEAMASNIPVVTQKDIRRTEIIGDAGVLVDCEDEDEFAKALSETAKRKWDNIPLNQAKKYNWETIKEKYLEIFDMILRR
jgi:glycosyltransferase involved in cell wall biosynthesis